MADELRAGTVLHHNTYRIIRELGQGGFGITYLAEEISLKRRVAIKEYFPQQWCGRDGDTSRVNTAGSGGREMFLLFKKKFLKEAQNIAEFNHPGIIRIHTSFEENSTAYYVMEYIEGTSLSALVKHRGPLDVATGVRYIRGIGEALEYIHAKNVTHLDVKPDNIMVRRDGDVPILIDFGLSKRYGSDDHATSTTPVGISHGYAPMEQYKEGGVSAFSPRADLYSLAATLYYMLTGQRPPDAHDVMAQGLSFPFHIPAHIQAAIVKAMAANPNDRQPNVAAFLNELSASPRPEPKPTPTEHTVIDNPVTPPIDPPGPPVRPHPTPSPAPQPHTPTGKDEEQKKPFPKQLLWGGVGLIGVAAVVLLILFWPKSVEPKPVEPEPVEVETEEVEGAETEDSPALYYDSSTHELVAGAHRYKMVYVDGGTFSMGATPEQSGPDSDEKPVHQVTLSSYYIGQTEVPQWLWVAVMGSNPSRWKGDDFPVERVSWEDCQKFLGKLNNMTGQHFQLPTEAQWEFAARGGNQSRGYQYSGSDGIGAVGWYRDNSDGRTHEVAQKGSNELGLYDMSGNVREWCSDWFGDYPDYSVTDPTGPSSGSNRVNRGGSWNFAPRYCLVAIRDYGTPGYRSDGLGFRLGG